MTERKYNIIAYIEIIGGTFLTAIGVSLFIAPAKIVDGGATGLATLLYYTCGFDIGIATLCISLPLFIAGTLMFGKAYGRKSLLGNLALSVFVFLLTNLTKYQGVLDYSNPNSMILSCLFGGVLAGTGMGLVIRGGANTGGTDILAQILAHSINPLSQGLALFLVDGIIIAISGFIFGIEQVLYGVFTATITTFMVDKVQMGFNTNHNKCVMIISEHPDAITRRIISELDHTGTVFTAKGMYSGEPKPVIMSVIQDRELARLVWIVHHCDKHAFMVVQNAYEVLGEGFSPIEEATWKNGRDITQQQVDRK